MRGQPRSALAAISLGANLGDRFATLAWAVRGLHRPDQGERVTAVSTWYETEPVGPPQPLYLNGCLTIETSCTPTELLARLQHLEALAGRTRGEHWGARTLDLDLLLFGACVHDEPDLTIPHPHLDKRSFVLIPLAEIAPNWVHPLLHKTIAELRAVCPGAGVERREERGITVSAGRPVELRPITPEDYPALQDLAARCWRSTYHGLLSDVHIESFITNTYNLAAIAHAAERPDGRYWVAEDHNRALVGFAQVLYGGDSAHLTRLYVAPECQAQGLGTALWNLARRTLRQLGVQACTLTVLQTNQAAIRFYERRGFERIGTASTQRYEYRIRL